MGRQYKNFLGRMLSSKIRVSYASTTALMQHLGEVNLTQVLLHLYSSSAESHGGSGQFRKNMLVAQGVQSKKPSQLQLVNPHSMH